MILGRYLTLTNDDQIDKELLKESLSLRNPAYYSAIEAGATESYLRKQSIPQVIKLFHEDKEGLHIPRYMLNDSVDSLTFMIDDELPIPSDIYTYPTIDIRPSPKFQPRDYQIQPIVDLVENRCDILHCKCGGGKTAMAVNALAKIKRKTAIVVNSDFLMDQWQMELLKFTDLSPSDIGKAIAGKELKKLHDKKVVLFTVQGLINKDYEEYKEFFDSFGLAIFDEVHLLGGEKFRLAIDLFICRRIGLTASIERTDKLRTFIWSVGNRITRVDYEGLKPNVFFMRNVSGTYDPGRYMLWNGKLSISKLINELCEDDERTVGIILHVDKLLRENRHVMVLTHRKSHVDKMVSILQNKGYSPLKLVGGQKKSDKVTQEQLENATVIIATFQYVRQALNVPHMDTLILTTPFGAYNDVEQSTGRILRSQDGKKVPEVYDVYDIDVGPSIGLAKKRRKAYRRLRYNILKDIPD